MSSPIRKVSPADIYHVVTKGIDNQAIFEGDAEKRKYQYILSDAKEKFPIKVYSSCIMENHMHLLLQVPFPQLTEAMHWINTKYSVWYNKIFERRGPLFQNRFISEAVADESYFMNCLRYIMQNPVKAHIVRHVWEYPWSSYHAYETLDNTFVNVSPVANRFHSREELLQFIETPLPKDVHVMEYYSTGRISDDMARNIIFAETNCAAPADFERLPAKMQQEFIIYLLDERISCRQLNRLCGVPYGKVSQIKKEHLKKANHNND